jgi:molybdopterin synthase catalytic subunit
MSVEVSITDGPLPAWTPAPGLEGAGAFLLFEGLVREREGDGRVTALDYQAYEPMAQSMLAQIGADIRERFGLSAVRIEHSRGRVPVGACSFRLVIQSPHRREALRAMDEFIDRLKQDVPIWKRPVWRGDAD